MIIQKPKEKEKRSKPQLQASIRDALFMVLGHRGGTHKTAHDHVTIEPYSNEAQQPSELESKAMEAVKHHQIQMWWPESGSHTADGCHDQLEIIELWRSQRRENHLKKRQKGSLLRKYRKKFVTVISY
ncbi:hypothetical protein GOBAR_AA21055 [Gossypium barbadense]|uniref:Uncharacterized protein n=1 Tax=Gossypium barbadense TaxID=3634 RepID=A0A2P5X8G3_GOSBA|nr:hypothetical protein GOBAR_AA21055 [Gossypium barbadense]